MCFVFLGEGVGASLKIIEKIVEGLLNLFEVNEKIERIMEKIEGVNEKGSDDCSQMNFENIASLLLLLPKLFKGLSFQ